MLVPAVRRLRDTFAAKARPCADVVMVGRTHLQDATPVTLGQVIGSWAAQLDQALDGVARATACTSSRSAGPRSAPA